MSMIRLPDGTTIAPLQPFSRELLKKSLEDLCTPEQGFTGFISVESVENLYLLFFFQGRPYGAGKFLSDKPSSLTIRDFFNELGPSTDPAATFSIHATDPVLLKSLLILVQGDPTVKAPASLINLEAVLQQIRLDAADALIILENCRMLNLFFFKDGNRGMAYFSDTEFHDADGMPFHEQMLLYAFQPEVQVNALIYRTTATHEAEDAPLVGLEEMLDLVRGEHREERGSGEDLQVPETGMVQGSLKLEILNGPRKGQTLTGPIPAVIGHTDADILLHDPTVSERHAAIQEIDGTLMLVDLNSVIGTTLNGVHIAQREIVEGDVIGIGATALRVVCLTPP
jgi:hypothetical protein